MGEKKEKKKEKKDKEKEKKEKATVRSAPDGSDKHIQALQSTQVFQSENLKQAENLLDPDYRWVGWSKKPLTYRRLHW